MPIGRLYQAPSINRTAPNARAAQWPQIGHTKKPFGSNNPSSFEYWFDYFWEEARESPDLSDGDRGRLCGVFLEVLTPSGAGFAPSPALRNMSLSDRRRILTTLLNIGFQRVARGVGGSQGFRAVEGPILFAEQIARANSSMRAIHIGYRGDARTYQEIRAAGGFRARARSWGQEVYQRYGMNQPWHPFAEPIYADSLYLRRGANRDNCLHTVVSVGTVFPRLVQFPILRDQSIFSLAGKPFRDWTPTDVATAQNHWLHFQVVRDNVTQKVVELRNQIRIYTVNVNDSRGFNTEKNWQKNDPFPERAMDEVPLENVLAEVVITRKYFWDNDCPNLYDIEAGAINLLPDRANIEQRYDASFAERVLQLVRENIQNTKRNLFEAKRRKENAGQAAASDMTLVAGQCPYCTMTFNSKPFLNNHIRRVHKGRPLVD